MFQLCGKNSTVRSGMHAQLELDEGIGTAVPMGIGSTIGMALKRFLLNSDD